MVLRFEFFTLLIQNKFQWRVIRLEVKWSQPFKLACNVLSGRGIPLENDMWFDNVSKLAIFFLITIVCCVH